jgi:predicted dienelactone hydrolase
MTSTQKAAGLTMLAALVVARLTAAPPQTSAPPAFELPAPTGRSPVGTTSWRLTDRSRQETFAAPGTFRQVEVIAWYPAAPGGRGVVPYLREGLAEVHPFAKLFGAETAFDGVQHVRTHAALDAPPLANPGKFPVLVFSHGYTGMPSSYTALLEDLASHGYAVLSVVHPYEASMATLADGRVASILSKDGTFVQGVQDVIAEWHSEDETMAAVTRAADDAEQVRLLRGYLGGLHKTDVALRRWVDDTKLVLDRLGSLPTSTIAGRLAATIDLGRLGAFGHSMGGVTAGQFCVDDRRCRAGLNLDGIPQYGTMIDTPMPRPFLMVYSARPGRGGASDPIYRRAGHPYLRVDVRDTGHLEFSDMVFWGGPLRERGVLGALAPARAVEITRTIVRQYFDEMLLEKRSPLLAGEALFPEVTVRTVPPPGASRDWD